MHQNLCVLNHYYNIKMNFISTSKSAKDLPIILITFHGVTHSVPSKLNAFHRFKNQWHEFIQLIAWHNGGIIKNKKMQNFSPINYSGVYKHRKLMKF